MTRPHIDFIQSQWLPRLAAVPGGARAGATAQLLSVDPDDGACSLVIHYPPGWSVIEQALDADEELFVLDGGMELDGRRLGVHGYAHLPAGYVRGRLSCPAGATVLVFFSREPVAGEPARFDARRLVPALDCRRMAGLSGPRPHMASEGFPQQGTLHRLLFDDPTTGDQTWLVALPPDWRCELDGTHPVCQEQFALAGDTHLPTGVMREGGYFWRPAGEAHGPFGTRHGSLHLCRGKGGPFATEFHPAAEPFAWDPPYRPILPGDYRTWIPDSPDGG